MSHAAGASAAMATVFFNCMFFKLLQQWRGNYSFAATFLESCEDSADSVASVARRRGISGDGDSVF